MHHLQVEPPDHLADENAVSMTRDQDMGVVGGERRTDGVGDGPKTADGVTRVDNTAMVTSRRANERAQELEIKNKQLQQEIEGTADGAPKNVVRTGTSNVHDVMSFTAASKSSVLT